MGVKGCWTCRARKVRCDLQRPTCNNCTRVHRVCQGYGIQLSWPRHGDERRAIILHHAKSSEKYPKRRHRGFINVSKWDIILAYKLRLGERYTTENPFNGIPMSVPTPLSHVSLGSNDAILLDFFSDSTSSALAPIFDEPLLKFILRIAFSNSCSISNAVLQAILALSSLCLQDYPTSMIHQNRAISILRDSIVRLDKQGLLENLTATMLLYQYELFNATERSQQWALYLSGAKRIIRSAKEAGSLDLNEGVILFDWIYYHEAMSEFSLRHWGPPQPISSVCQGPVAKSPDEIASRGYATSNVTDGSMETIDLIANICHRSPTGQSGKHIYTESNLKRIHELERRIYNVIGDKGSYHDGMEAPFSRGDLLCALHKFSALIYLNRSMANVSVIDFRHERLVREGFLILEALGFCEVAWPLFILACEANTDQRRSYILQLFSRMRKDRSIRLNHIAMIQSMVEAVWNQMDLDEDDEVGYIDIMSAVISRAPSLPLFA